MQLKVNYTKKYQNNIIPNFEISYMNIVGPILFESYPHIKIEIKTERDTHNSEN